MRALVIYESMFGNTRRVAEAIADGLASAAEVRLIRADRMTSSDLDGTVLVVIGAPTHVWSLPRAKTRQGSPDYVAKSGGDLVLEPGAASSPGVREWLSSLTEAAIPFAIFDTRFEAPGMFTGRASKSISRSIRRRGIEVLLAPESFLVDRKNHLIPGEVERARIWGFDVGAQLASRSRLDWSS